MFAFFTALQPVKSPYTEHTRGTSARRARGARGQRLGTFGAHYPHYCTDYSTVHSVRYPRTRPLSL